MATLRSICTPLPVRADWTFFASIAPAAPYCQCGILSPLYVKSRADSANKFPQNPQTEIGLGFRKPLHASFLAFANYGNWFAQFNTTLRLRRREMEIPFFLGQLRFLIRAIARQNLQELAKVFFKEKLIKRLRCRLTLSSRLIKWKARGRSWKLYRRSPETSFNFTTYIPPYIIFYKEGLGLYFPSIKVVFGKRFQSCGVVLSCQHVFVETPFFA